MALEKTIEFYDNTVSQYFTMEKVELENESMLVLRIHSGAEVDGSTQSQDFTIETASDYVEFRKELDRMALAVFGTEVNDY